MLIESSPPAASGHLASSDVSVSRHPPGSMETKNPYLFPDGLLNSLSTSDETSEVAGPSGNCAAVVRAEPGQWFLVHTKPRQEKKLAEELRKLGVPHYLPVTHCKSVTRGRSRYAWLPLFPSYLFLKATNEQRLLALKTNRIVATHLVVDQESLDRNLSDLADLIEKDVPLRIEERLVAGQEVEIIAGLLKGKRGTVIKRGGKTRLFLMIAEILGGVSLEIEQHYVNLL
ncbi:transcription termination/antitermination NusG family protein [Bythopirellula goksoeyrii]|nr:transcription termination/antitermination NusG family protein [Bythopirellula goksoeyrii]